MTAEQEFGAWVKDYAYRAERAGWTLKFVTIGAPNRGWSLVPYVSISGEVTRFNNALEVWAYVLKFADSQLPCRRAVEFMAKWNPSVFDKAVVACKLKKTPAWLEMLLITAELRA